MVEVTEKNFLSISAVANRNKLLVEAVSSFFASFYHRIISYVLWFKYNSRRLCQITF